MHDMAGYGRIRWAAIGAAVAVTLGAGGIGVVRATVSSGPKPIFVSITPCRLVDTRPAPSTVGTRGTPLNPGEIATFTVHGTNGNCTIPADATAIDANVTITAPTSDGFLTMFPSDAPLPNASNLNWSAGQAPTPNAVTVDLSADGKVNVFNERGTVNVIIDIVGYYEDHNHDDRYVPQGEIVMSHGAGAFGNPPLSVQVFGHSFANQTGSGAANMPLDGPSQLGGVKYGLSSITYCLDILLAGPIVNAVTVSGSTNLFAPVVTATDETDRTADGCFSVTVSDPNSTSFIISWYFTGGPGDLRIVSVTSSWAPTSTIMGLGTAGSPAPSDTDSSNG